MANVSVAILGLGRIGASVALALQRYNESKEAQHHFDVVWADLRSGIREDAQKLGLKAERDLFNAARDRDIVLLALPYADVEAAYKSIGADLRPGAVVLDTAPLKTPSLKWAGAHLSKEAHVIGITPICNPRYLFDEPDDTVHAHADLFDKGAMLVTPGAGAVRDAVELAADFVTLLGAAPHFVDPAEHDSLMAMTEGLPSLLGVAVFHMMSQSAGWPDAQRFTNPSFGRLTHHLYDTHPDDLRDLWLNNRDDLLRQVDATIESLRIFRTLLAQNDRDALEAALVQSSDAYAAWINRRHSAKWEDEKADTKGFSLGGMIVGNLMGSFIGKRLGGRKNGKDK